MALRGRITRKSAGRQTPIVAAPPPPPGHNPAANPAPPAAPAAPAPQPVVVNPPRQPAVVVAPQAASTVWYWSWRIAIALAVVVLAVLLLANTDSTGTGSGYSFDIDLLTIALAFAALAAVGGGMYYFSDKKRLGTYVYVITLVLLVYWFYRYDFLDIPRTYLLYVLAGVGAVMVWSYVKGFSKLTLGLLVGAVFLMLGYSHHHSWNQFADMVASIGWSDGRGTGFASAPTGRKCSQVVQRAELSDSSVEELNPGGNCHIELHEVVQGQCVYAYDRWNTLIGDDCSGSYANMDDKYPAKFQAAVFGTVQVTYVLCEKPGPRRIVADGCP